MVQYENLTDENIQTALGKVALDNTLIFRYNGVNKWNKDTFMGHRIENEGKDIKAALIFEQIGNKDLARAGYKLAFVAMFPIDNKKFAALGKRVKISQYDADGKSVAGAVGLYGPDGKLVVINPKTDWVDIDGFSPRAAVGYLAACLFAFRGMRMYTGYSVEKMARGGK